MLHKKDLGKMGEALIAQQALKRGCSVFVEFGDNSKIDLIVQDVNDKLHRVQVKVVGRHKDNPNVTPLYLYKNGPGYRYTYRSTDVDWFAVIDDVTEKVAWVPSSICDENASCINLRHALPANGQKKRIRMFDDYETCPFPPLV